MIQEPLEVLINRRLQTEQSLKVHCEHVLTLKEDGVTFTGMHLKQTDSIVAFFAGVEGPSTAYTLPMSEFFMKEVKAATNFT